MNVLRGCTESEWFGDDVWGNTIRGRNTYTCCVYSCAVVQVFTYDSKCMFQHAETNHENKLEIAMLFRFLLLLLLIVGERLEILAFARSRNNKKNEKLRSQWLSLGLRACTFDYLISYDRQHIYLLRKQIKDRHHHHHLLTRAHGTHSTSRIDTGDAGKKCWQSSTNDANK